MAQVFRFGWNITDSAVIESVRAIDVMPEQEVGLLLNAFNDSYADYPADKCVHELFTEQAKRTPDETALIFRNRRFTYRNLDSMSDSLARYLRREGIHRNEVVPIIARRDWRIIVAMLAILKAGGAYMPVSPDYPEERIRAMLSVAECRIALCYGYDGSFPVKKIDLMAFDFGKNQVPVANINKPDDLCYIIFTSGSTGTPKGVSVMHHNVSNYVHNNNNNNVVGNIIRNGYQTIVSVTNIVFDIFVTESLLPILNGKTICFADDDESMFQSKLASLVEQNNVDVIQTTPTRMRTYLMDKSNLSYLRKLKVIVLGGEAFPPELYTELRCLTNAHVFNIYGPAETTVWSTNVEVTSASGITIGRPIANTQIYILDDRQNLLPIGVAGELCIAGEGVGKGYLNRPDLTAEKFITNPYATEENGHGKVLYRTGDLAKWRIDGEIEYLGRIDTQVKIRGLRIELGEIESVMAETQGIGLVAAAAQKDETGRQYLVGYYTSDTEIDEIKLRGRLAKKLPKYMVPNYFMRLDAMPMTASGKTDRKNLPVPDMSSEMHDYVAPVTEKEAKLCKLMEDVLSIERIGTLDDFFELGGDSLKALSFVAMAHEAGIEISLQNVYDHATVQEMCEYIQSQASGEEKVQNASLSDSLAEINKSYNKLLCGNKIDESMVFEKKTVGNVLLTGATGFLGSHILDALMKNESSKVYCLVRGDSDEAALHHLKETLQWYFGNRYHKEIGGRIIPVRGEIGQENLSDTLPGNVKTVIHAAALVKHFGRYEIFHDVNVEGTENVIKYAEKNNIRKDNGCRNVFSDRQ